MSRRPSIPSRSSCHIYACGQGRFPLRLVQSSLTEGSEAQPSSVSHSSCQVPPLCMSPVLGGCCDLHTPIPPTLYRTTLSGCYLPGILTHSPPLPMVETAPLARSSRPALPNPPTQLKAQSPRAPLRHFYSQAHGCLISCP